MSQSYVISLQKVPSPWQDPVMTPTSTEQLLTQKNVTLFSHQEKIGTSDGHILTRSDGQDLEILTLWVQPEQRRKSIAYTLLKHTIAEAMKQRAHTLFLEVRTSNVPAKKLYKKMGFQHIAVRPNYYQNPTEDAQVLSLKLK